MSFQVSVGGTEIDRLWQQGCVSFCLEEQCFLTEVRWQGNYHHSRWTIHCLQEVPISRARFAKQSEKKHKIAVEVCGLEWMLCFASMAVAVTFHLEVMCELLKG